MLLFELSLKFKYNFGIAGSANGRQPGSEPGNHGPNPCPATKNTMIEPSNFDLSKFGMLPGNL